DLCFLLRSPLFLYAISPRLRHATNPLRVDGLIKAEDINIYALNMMILSLIGLIVDISGDDSSWATQLLYGGTSLIEGRQYITTEQAGFAQSFHWFRDEARFLNCEFHARELAAAEALGIAVSMKPAVVKPVQVDLRQTRARAAAQKQRRIVKLRIRYQMIHGRPVLMKGPR
ncbi:hypothetical protein J4E82_010409, partial [Alternaria postmessia]|uniref:uncharacterized protein n=1 Tax=Alternaria postmessia TaxID=1187938 RepID=UPI0022249BE6